MWDTKASQLHLTPAEDRFNLSLLGPNICELFWLMAANSSTIMASNPDAHCFEDKDPGLFTFFCLMTTSTHLECSDQHFPCFGFSPCCIVVLWCMKTLVSPIQIKDYNVCRSMCVYNSETYWLNHIIIYVNISEITIFPVIQNVILSKQAFWLILWCTYLLILWWWTELFYY